MRLRGYRLAGSRPAGAKGRKSRWKRLAGLAAAITPITALAALLFTGLSLRQTVVQNELAQSGQITDRFNSAVSNLGSNTETIRIGGIYALQRIMRDSPRDQPAVIQVLAAFIRECAPLHALPPPPASCATATTPTSPAQLPTSADQNAAADLPSSAPAIDVQTALDVLATRDPAQDQGTVIDLADTELRGMTLVYADLTKPFCECYHFDNTDFAGSDLTDVNLSFVTLRRVDFAGANLEQAYIYAADFTNASFKDANLSRAHFSLTNNLDSAYFAGANLKGANLGPTFNPEDPPG